MKRKILVLVLSVTLLASLLAGCGSTGSPNGSPSASSSSVGTSPAAPSPSVSASASPGSAGASAAGTASPSGTPAINSTDKTTFAAKVTALSGSTLTLDVYNGTMTKVSGTPSPAVASVPPKGATVSSNMPLTLSDTTNITLKSGSKGQISDIKVGNTLSVTMTTSAVTDITVIQ